MADLEIDDDFREKFAYLFKPITDFAKGFEIDLIEVLRDYDSKTFEADTGFNFVNAAAMLQGTTNVYGKRVDILHKAVSNFTDPALEKERRKQAAARTNDEDDDVADKEPDEVRVDPADDAVQEPVAANAKASRLNADDDSYRPPADRTHAAEEINEEEGQRGPNASDLQVITKVKLPERLHRNIAKASIDDNCLITRDSEEGLCIFERFHTDGGKHYPMYVTMKREYPLMYTMPGNMMPLLQGEKRPVELLDLNGMKYGDVDDYRMCRDYVVHNFSIFSNLGGTFCYEVHEDHVAAFAEIQQYLRSANGNQQPERCINDIERTLESDMKRGRPSQHLIELCRRISDGTTTHRYSEGLELDHVFTPLPPDEDYSFGGHNSFAPMDDIDREPFEAVADSIQPEGRVTRSSRQSRRLTAQAPAPRVEFDDGTFREADLYEPDEFCNKPVELVRRMKTASRKALRLRQLRRRKNNDREPLLVEEIADYFANDCKDLRAAMERNMVDNNISWAFQPLMLREQQRRQAVQKELKRARLRGQRALRNLANLSLHDVVDVPIPPPSAQDAVNALEQSLRDLDNQEVYSFNDVTAGSFIGDPVPMGDAMDNDMNASIHFAALNATAVRTQDKDKENTQPLSVFDANDDATDYVDVHDEGLEVPDTDDAMLFADLPENSTIQNVVRVFLNRKWNMALKKQPECAVKLAKWERKMHPILTNLTDDFAAHDYGSKALDCFEGEIGKSLNFEELAQGTPNERSRYLLSLLMLSNRDNVMLHSAHEGVIDERVDVDDVNHEDFQVELLNDADWHGNEMNQSGLI
uniref:Condensin-2 complex subunit H2 n=1 Tax=Panagrellus redivivus TaxID=6233 RepID=A0A7E4V7A1_PANRE